MATFAHCVQCIAKKKRPTLVHILSTQQGILRKMVWCVLHTREGNTNIDIDAKAINY